MSVRDGTTVVLGSDDDVVECLVGNRCFLLMGSGALLSKFVQQFGEMNLEEGELGGWIPEVGALLDGESWKIGWCYVGSHPAPSDSLGKTVLTNTCDPL